VAKIFFSLSGEGRGHATRVRALIETLRLENSIAVFASGEAYRFLAPLYRGTGVRLHRIGGLRFHYTPHRRLNYRKTLWEAARFARRLPLLVRMLERRLVDEHPDLVITDFEPALPRAAKNVGIPFISIDHQHFLTTYDLSSLPLFLRLHAWTMAQVVKAYYWGQQETVVSSFYFPPLKPGCRNVTQVGVMLRPEVLSASIENQPHLVAYWRRFASQQVMDALKECGREVRVYGLGVQPRQANLIFRPICERTFLEDLATSSGLVSTAGNQLVGEAQFLGKPVLALPEARNFEQYINASFLAESGGGAWVEMEKASVNHVQDFLNTLDTFRSRINRQKMNGLPDTLAAIRRNLPAHARAEAPGKFGPLKRPGTLEGHPSQKE
jgi:uncharacterized protein (TIGR00661 family)